MKRLVVILAALALLLAGCTPAKDAGGPDPKLRGQWELQSAKDAAGPLPLADQRITLTIGGDNSTTGRSTCSDYTARVYGTTSKLWVDPRLPGAASCRTGALRTLEERYIKALQVVHYGSISDGVLTLKAARVTLTYSRALHIPLTLVTDRTWQIQLIAQDASTTAPTLLIQAPLAVSGASIVFDKNGTLSGSDGCRGFSAQYTQNAGELVIHDLKSGKNGCSEADLTVDTYLMNLLASGFTWQSGNALLSLDSPRAGVEITFEENPIRGSDLG